MLGLGELQFFSLPTAVVTKVAILVSVLALLRMVMLGVVFLVAAAKASLALKLPFINVSLVLGVLSGNFGLTDLGSLGFGLAENGFWSPRWLMFRCAGFWCCSCAGSKGCLASRQIVCFFFFFFFTNSYPWFQEQHRGGGCWLGEKKKD